MPIPSYKDYLTEQATGLKPHPDSGRFHVVTVYDVTHMNPQLHHENMVKMFAGTDEGSPHGYGEYEAHFTDAVSALSFKTMMNKEPNVLGAITHDELDSELDDEDYES